MAFPYLGLSFPNMGTKMRSRKWARLTIVPPTDIIGTYSLIFRKKMVKEYDNESTVFFVYSNKLFCFCYFHIPGKKTPICQFAFLTLP